MTLNIFSDYDFHLNKNSTKFFGTPAISMSGNCSVQRVLSKSPESETEEARWGKKNGYSSTTPADDRLLDYKDLINYR